MNTPNVVINTCTEDLGNGQEIQKIIVERLTPVGTPLPTIPEWFAAAIETVAKFKPEKTEP